MKRNVRQRKGMLGRGSAGNLNMAVTEGLSERKTRRMEIRGLKWENCGGTRFGGGRGGVQQQACSTWEAYKRASWRGRAVRVMQKSGCDR